MQKKILDSSSINRCQHFIPHIRYINEDRYNKPWVLNERKIFDYEFILVTKGEGVFYIEDRVYYVKPNHLLLLHPNILHSGRSKHLPFHFICIHFDVYISPMNSTLGINSQYVNESVPIKPVEYTKATINLKEYMVLEDSSYTSLLFKRIYNEAKEKQPAFNLAIKAFFTDLLVNLFREQNGFSEKSRFSPEVKAVIDHIKANYMNNITLRGLSAVVHLHPSYISNLFKKQTGITLSRFITMHRISEAKKLLLETNRKIDDIAQATGFYDLHQFSNVFKKYEGLSPSQYRKIKR